MFITQAPGDMPSSHCKDQFGHQTIFRKETVVFRIAFVYFQNIFISQQGYNLVEVGEWSSG